MSDKQKTSKQQQKPNKTLQELEDDAGCFLAMPKERFEAIKLASTNRAKTY